ncbi:MAG: SEL1-like repeat protein, partial [Clostridia bacterium]|nr:SEL1-like repeat protein [Clostridia bacterium]
CNLGRMYFCGEGTKIDFAKSREYFHRAIAYGDTSPAAIRGVQMIDDFYNKHPYLFDCEIK